MVLKANLIEKPKKDDINKLLLNALMSCNGIGEKKAMILLQHFKTLKNICNAEFKELEDVIGSVLATKLIEFFHTQ
ncbi:hypothetical protein HK099_006446 [Clydaea vesicula]|uniref:DisA/LigA helix-hairpin-helix motif domain-containing protein n=1 Tax=Clydaea vesicula TaxID=447962 RepID=A0AAD5XUB8_9FUNG|nr:hypothetical protein HK099_006446 [Clydaea vesicula]